MAQPNKRRTSTALRQSIPDTFYSLVPDTSYSPFIPLLFRTCYSALWGIFGRAVCVVLCFASTGCWWIHSAPTPVLNGSWDGVLRLVTVLDEDEVRHDVLGVLLVDEIHVTVDSRGGGYDAKNDTSWFWMFWPHERVALLVDKQLRLLRPGEIAESVDDHVIFRGTVRKGDPVIDGKEAIRLSRSGRITKSDGTILRVYSSGGESVARGVIERKTGDAENGAQDTGGEEKKP
jgi:hypothetical protein